MKAPLRCPKCSALVVDRRSALCTTCRCALPREWIMTAKQISKVEAFDRDARAEHAFAMTIIDPNGQNILFRQTGPNGR